MISTYATCTNLRQIVTPDLKSTRMGKSGSLYHIEVISKHMTAMRLGGSVFAQIHKSLGNESPDVEYPNQLKNAFNAIQTLIKGEREKLILFASSFFS